jgi:hypothetical protein
MPWKDKHRIYVELLQLRSSRRRAISTCVIPRLQPCERRTAKVKSTTSSHGGPLGGHSSRSSPHQSCPTQVYCVKILNTSNHIHRRQMGKACGTPCSSMFHKRKFRKQVCQHWSDQNDLRLPRLLISGRHLPLKIAAPKRRISSHH